MRDPVSFKTFRSPTQTFGDDSSWFFSLITKRIEMNQSLKKVEQYFESLEKRGVKSFLMGKTSAPAPEKVASDQVAEEIVSPVNKREDMMSLYKEVMKCTKCTDLVASRNSIVFGKGNVNAKLVIVGEAPGYDEDQQGLPFVGKSGQLLTKIIESIGFKREDVFICNVLKCRPPENRNPNPDEILNCQPYLKRQLKIINPDVICCLGKFACQTLLNSPEPISRLRGKWAVYEGVKLMPTFHPAYLLRNPAEKKKVWEDMKQIRDELNH